MNSTERRVMILALIACGMAVFSTMAAAETTNQNGITADPSPPNKNDVIWKPNGEMGLQVGEPGVVVVVNKTASESIGSGLNLSFCSVAWRPDNSYALIIGQRGAVMKFIDMRSGLVQIESHTSVDLKSVSWKPDGSFALITGTDGVMLRFDHFTQACFQVETDTLCPLGEISWDNSGQHARIKAEDGNTITYPPPEQSGVPRIAILEPAMGSSVSGTCTFRGAVTLDSGTVSRLEWRLDSSGWQPMPGGADWELVLDTSAVSNGYHTLSVRATGSAGGQAAATTWMTVDNAILPPTITIASPCDTDSVSGMIVISGSAAAWYGPVERVDVRLDCNGWGPAVGSGDWFVTIDTTTLANGVHRLDARAWDGRSFAVASYAFTVLNPLPAPPKPAPSESGAKPPSARADRPALVDGTPALPGTSVPQAPQDPAGAPPVTPAIKTADGGTITVPAVSWTIILLVGLALATEHGKFAIFQFLFVPLYSRIKKDRVLDNFTRGMIYGFIMSNPGVHYNFIKQKLGLNNGSIVYHLTVLERQELIKSEKVGLYKRFYPLGGTLSENGVMELTDAQESLLEILRQSPGLTQREIALRMGLSGRVVNYHVGLLQRARLLTLEKVGKVTRCYATERMPVC